MYQFIARLGDTSRQRFGVYTLNLLSSYFTSYWLELTLEEVTTFGEKDLHGVTENYKSNEGKA